MLIFTIGNGKAGWSLAAGPLSLVSRHRWYSCCYQVMLDTRFSILDELHIRNGQNVIEHRESSIEYQVLPATRE